MPSFEKVLEQAVDNRQQGQEAQCDDRRLMPAAPTANEEEIEHTFNVLFVLSKQKLIHQSK